MGAWREWGEAIQASSARVRLLDLQDVQVVISPVEEQEAGVVAQGWALLPVSGQAWPGVSLDRLHTVSKADLTEITLAASSANLLGRLKA